jgi:hypothetical protein
VSVLEDLTREQLSERPRSWLLRWLNDEQRRTFEARRYFMVCSPDGRRRYRLDTGQSGNVALVSPLDRVLATFSIHQARVCHDECIMLVQKFILDADENAFLLAAHWHVRDEAAHEVLAAPTFGMSRVFSSSEGGDTRRRMLQNALGRVDASSPYGAFLTGLISGFGGDPTQRLWSGSVDGDTAKTKLQDAIVEFVIQFNCAAQGRPWPEGFFGGLALRAAHWLNLSKDHLRIGRSPEFEGMIKHFLPCPPYPAVHTLREDSVPRRGHKVNAAIIAATAAEPKRDAAEPRSQVVDTPYEPDELLSAYRRKFPCAYKELCAAANVDKADFKKWRKKHPKMYPASAGARRLLKILRSDEGQDWWRRHPYQFY